MKTQTENKAGLVERNNDAIYISKDSFDFTWSVFKTNVGGCQATQIFTFQTSDQAWKAAEKIAAAIGGKFYGKVDPRKT